jgi:putative ABC transport system permease protein
MVLRETSRLILGGLVLGLPLCYGLSRLMRAQLYRLSALDPASFLAGTAIISLVVFAAALLPARKAAAVDPMAVLRSE